MFSATQVHAGVTDYMFLSDSLREEAKRTIWTLCAPPVAPILFSGHRRPTGPPSQSELLKPNVCFVIEAEQGRGRAQGGKKGLVTWQPGPGSVPAQLSGSRLTVGAAPEENAASDLSLQQSDTQGRGGVNQPAEEKDSATR